MKPKSVQKAKNFSFLFYAQCLEKIKREVPKDLKELVIFYLMENFGLEFLHGRDEDDPMFDLIVKFMHVTDKARAEFERNL